MHKAENCHSGMSLLSMDEYVGLPQEHPESYYSYVEKLVQSYRYSSNVSLLDGNATGYKLNVTLTKSYINLTEE